MINRVAAKHMVEEHLNHSYPASRSEITGPLIVLDNETIEKPYGWVFFYTTAKSLTSKEMRYRLAGNGPVVVTRSEGKIYELTSGLSVEKAISQFEESIESTKG